MGSMNEALGLTTPTGPFTLTLADGKEYQMYPLSAGAFKAVQCHIKGVTGEESQGTAFLAGIIWQALLPEHADMTPELAERLIPFGWYQLGTVGMSKLLTALDVQADVTEAPADADPTEPTT